MLNRIMGEQFTGIGSRLMRLYLLMLLIPVAGIGLYGSVYIQRTLSDSAIQNGLGEVRIRALTLNTLLSQIHNDILYLGQRADDSISNSAADPSAELTGFAASHPTYQSITWIDPNGRELGGHLSETLANWTQTNAFDNMLSLNTHSIRFMPMRVADRSNDILMLVAARLESGLLVFEIDTAYLLNSLTDPKPEVAWALMMYPNTYLTTAEDSTVFINDEGRFAGSSGYLTEAERTNLYHYAGPGGSWTLVRSVPSSSLSADLSNYYITFALLLIGGLISVAGLALFSIARIIDPVYQLERMVDQMRHGSRRPQLPTPLPTDEFGKLMLAFDQMATELEERRQDERAVIEQIIRAQEEERKLIAFDLHDGLIQQLVGARFYLGHCRNTCQKHPKMGKQGVANSYDVLTNAISEGRRIIQGLHPTVLEDLGLEAALSELARETGNTAGWQVEVDTQTLTQQPDRATSVTLYRITQEALNNAFKHAEAEQVKISMTIADDQLFVCIQDDGRGFDPDNIPQDDKQHWGIKTMHERAAMVGGSCDITSQPKHGTAICVRVPYSCSNTPDTSYTIQDNNEVQGVHVR